MSGELKPGYLPAPKSPNSLAEEDWSLLTSKVGIDTDGRLSPNYTESLRRDGALICRGDFDL